MNRAGALLLCVLGSLVVLVATAAGWVSIEVFRDVGGVTVGEAESISGSSTAPWLLVLGLAAIPAGVVLALLPRSARAAGGLLVAALGVVTAIAALVAGTVLLDAGAGERTPGPFFAAAGGALVAAGGVLALRSGPRDRRKRYDIDPDARLTDSEWDLASDDDTR